MLASPPEIENDALIAAVLAIEGVEDMHQVHFWQIDESQVSVDAHIVLARDHWDRLEDIKRDIKGMLTGDFGIQHSTLEFEHPDHAHQGAAIYGHG